MTNKFNAKSVETPDGKFDSRMEYRRWRQLKLLEKAGKISNLQRQVKFQIIPKQPGERAACYVADFTYTESGAYIVEDCKGKRTPEYVLKRKLMLWVHGIVIRETVA